MGINVLLFNKIRWDIIRYDEIINSNNNFNIYSVGTKKYNIGVPDIWKNFCKEYHIVNEINIEWFTGFIEKLPQLNKIICFAEEDLYLASLLRQVYNVQGFLPSYIKNFRDKFYMREHISKNCFQIKMPNYVLASEVDLEFSSLQKQLNSEILVLKPRYGMSSSNICLLKNNLDFNKVKQEFLQYEKSMWLLEEYIPSKEFFHVDSIIRNNKINSNCYQYLQPLLDSIGNVLGGCILKGNFANLLIATNEALLKALQVNNTCTHAEYFFHNNELYCCEIGLRIPGSNVVLASEVATGINQAQQWLCNELDIEYQKSEQKSEFAGYIDFSTLKKGVITDMKKLEKEFHWVIPMRKMYKNGDLIHPSGKEFERFSSYIFTANTQEQIVQRLYMLANIKDILTIS